MCYLYDCYNVATPCVANHVNVISTRTGFQVNDKELVHLVKQLSIMALQDPAVTQSKILVTILAGRPKVLE